MGWGTAEKEHEGTKRRDEPYSCSHPLSLLLALDLQISHSVCLYKILLFVLLFRAICNIAVTYTHAHKGRIWDNENPGRHHVSLSPLFEHRDAFSSILLLLQLILISLLSFSPVVLPKCMCLPALLLACQSKRRKRESERKAVLSLSLSLSSNLRVSPRSQERGNTHEKGNMSQKS